ncbi:MAG: hypothetical protein KJ607_14955 [Bacteroidetes bacterium]|nr:hypothetical protein [Bacteroidota bacterium]
MYILFALFDFWFTFATMSETAKFEFYGLMLSEPATFITDLLTAFLCIIFAVQIHKKYPGTRKNWKLFFVSMALASFTGAFAHLLIVYTKEYLKIVSWVLSGFPVLFAELGSLSLLKKLRLRRILGYICIIQITAYMVFIILFQDFSVARINLIAGLFVIVPAVQLLHYKGKLPPGNRLIISGLVLSLSIAFIHGLRISLHYRFNHNDLSHLVMMACLFTIYLGVRKSGSSI